MLISNLHVHLDEGKKSLNMAEIVKQNFQENGNFSHKLNAYLKIKLCRFFKTDSRSLICFRVPVNINNT